MANTFKLFIEQDGDYQKVRAVFPFTSGELLDERLDESKVVFFSRVKDYKPLTEFKVEFNESGKINEEYYILANDNSAEYPAGSAVYRHEAYLIERTKLLEGVVCPSLTFTNALPISYDILSFNVLNGDEMYEDNGNDTPIQTRFNDIYQSVTPSILTKGKTYTLPSSKNVCEHFAKWLTNINLSYGSSSALEFFYSDFNSSNPVFTCAKYNGETAYWQNELTITPDDNFTLVYECCVYYGVIDQNLRFTLPFNVKVVDKKAQPAPWTITECVNRVLECAEPVFVGPDGASQIFRFKLDGVPYEYDSNGSLISDPNKYSGTALKYKNVLAPEFSMTQSTLREQLKVIGSFIHAEPYIIDKDVTGAYIIGFLDYGSQKTPKVIGANTPYISNTLKTDINSFCTDVRSNAQNLINSLSYAKGAVIEPTTGEPNENKPYYLGIKGETQYAMLNDKDGFADTNYPIQEVGSVLCGLLDNEYNWLYEPKDITPYVFEATEYGANLDSFNGKFPYAKKYAIYYTMGQKGLHGLFYQAPSATSEAADSPFAIANILAAVNAVDTHDAFKNVKKFPSNLVFQITYKPIAPAFVSHGKQLYISGEQKFTQIYNQGENLIETNYFGENLKGVAARLGNTEQERTYMLSSLAQVPRVGEMIDGYAISAVHTEFMPSYVKCTLGLSKDFNRISEYVGVSSVKRMYEISERQAQERDILIKEDIIISKTQGENDKYVIFSDVEKLTMPLCNLPSLNNIDYRVKGAFFKAFDKNLNPIALPDDTPSNRLRFSNGLFLPVLCRSFGNSVHLSFKMKDNYSAGNNTPYITDSSENIYGRFMSDIPYTDFYGRIYYAGIAFGTELTNNALQLSSFELPQNKSRIGALNFLNDNFIISRAYEEDENGNQVLDSLSGRFSIFHRVRKDNREILSYNVEAEFKTDIPELIIGSELAARSRLITNEVKEVVIYLSNTPINKFAGRIDTDAGTVIESPVIEQDGNRVKIFLDERKEAYKYWAIATKVQEEINTYADEGGGTVDITTEIGGDILLAGNTSNFDTLETAYLGNAYELDLYFITKRR